MFGTSNILELWRIPSNKLLFRMPNFAKGTKQISRTTLYPIVCLCKEIQTASSDILTASYISDPKSKRVNKLQLDEPVKIESMGAFQKLPMVMPSSDLLHSSLRKAKRVSATKGIANIAKRERNRGAKQLDALMKELAVPLRMYVENFPNKRHLHPYERSLIELTLGDGNYEEVLGKVNNLRKKITSVGKESAALCAKSLTKKEAEERLGEGLTRLEETFIREKKAVDDLMDIAKSLRAMPVVNLQRPTLCLVGAPNVGKSSLVRVLSTGKPEICNYPFTTRGILMGHISINFQHFQVTDTPGLLTRCDEDRNNLEKLTLAVLSHLPTAVLYVHDLTGECGTSPSDQFITYKEIRERFNDHLWLDVVSKCDLLHDSPSLYVTEDSTTDNPDLARYRMFGPEGALRVSVTSEIGLDELKKKVHELLISQSSRIELQIVEPDSAGVLK